MHITTTLNSWSTSLLLTYPSPFHLRLPRLTPSALPRHLLEKQVLGAHPWPAVSKTVGVGTCNLCFLCDFDTSEFESHWSRCQNVKWFPVLKVVKWARCKKYLGRDGWCLAKGRACAPPSKFSLQSFPSISVAMRKPKFNVARCLKFSKELKSLNFYVKYLDS